ncbi:BtrH N-terminal domain-containing protein [Paenibacillus oenotherae]|uniref:BtrH N-terminal domain-containing protein n=1 Tax=Paenibacillus oenotherae TaxID=1435645 RepID=A0ABS7D7M0_9BACL|nr:BtrH N-terminal domain-containing protein [Paenibacillus oenotherae]MBW7475876.1 BtrH N-terminal domain-containing protein [Paenibacillus oenotherae]
MIVHIPFIYPNKDSYPLDQVNCIEKPLSMVAEGKRKFFSSYYFILVKCIDLYRVSKVKKNSNGFYQNAKEVMSLLGLNVHFFNRCNDFHTIIREQLRLQRPVLVCGNLRLLYYSHHYKTSDWMHLFLVKGYNDETDVYYIMDSTQKKDGGYRFEEFTITSEMLENLAISSHEIFATELIFSVETADREPLESELLITCTNEILNAPLVNNEFIAMVDYQDNRDMDEQTLATKLIRMTKSKEVLYIELTSQFKRFLGHVPLIEQIENLAAQLIQEWTIVIAIYMRSMLKKEIFDTGTRLEKVLHLEKSMKTCLEEVQTMLHALREAQGGQAAKSIWTEENNEDNILKFDGNTASFSFQTKKEHDYINCPKIMYPIAAGTNDQSLLYTANISIIKKPHVPAYQAGIVFRTGHGETYMWGIINNEKIVLSQSIDPIFSLDIEGDVNRLQVRLDKNGEYIFSYAEQEKSMVDVYRTNALSRLSGIGIGCRNWFSVQPMQLQFISHLDVQ